MEEAWSERGLSVEVLLVSTSPQPLSPRLRCMRSQRPLDTLYHAPLVTPVPGWLRPCPARACGVFARVCSTSNKIAALSFTRFRKVVVLDNDAGLLQNMDHLVRTAPTPAAVFHTTIGPLAKRTRCAVTTGLLVLRPSRVAFARALALLSSMNYTKEQYDGGDEEFWLRFFAESAEPLYELPWRYHAHRLLPMSASEWERVRMIHLITALAGRGWHIPKNVTMRAERYPT